MFAVCAVHVLEPADLCLVSLPWALAHHPSLQVGALKAYLEQHGFRVQALHLHAGTPGIVGSEAYGLSQVRNLGEKLSAAAANRDGRAEKLRILAEHYPGPDWPAAVERLGIAFDRWARLLARLETPRIGFSASLLQFMASATVAARVKALAPEKEIILGGAALLGDLPRLVLERYPQFDYAVGGEGEETLLEWLRARMTGADLAGIPGLWHRAGGPPPPRPPLPDLDQLPSPDFDEFFQFYPPVPAPRLTYEMARGCFYDKCTFCNLNEVWGTRATRRKSAVKVAAELTELAQRHQVDRIMFCDTNVSDRADFFELWRLPGHPRMELSGEVSAHLHRRDFLRMRLAGVRDIQIGIESFSPRVLKRMQKGVSVMRNVEMIRWCDELGIALFYNIMLAFPGEEVADRQETLRVMQLLQPFQWPRLAHYTVSMGSPLHAELTARGVDLRPPEGFAAYFGAAMVPLAPLLDPVIGLEWLSSDQLVQEWGDAVRFVAEWQASYEALEQRPGLIYRDNGAQLAVHRFTPERAYLVLAEPARSIMLFCQRESRTRRQISARFPDLPADMIQRCLHEAEAAGLLFAAGERHFFLPVLADPLERLAAWQQEADSWEQAGRPESAPALL